MTSLPRMQLKSYKLLGLLTSVLLSACNNNTVPQSSLQSSTPGARASVPSTRYGLEQQAPQILPAPIVLDDGAGVTAHRPAVQFFGGSSDDVSAQVPTEDASFGITSDIDNGISLNFSNADVRDVAQAVLGDFLKLNYQVDPSVQGTITLSTASPVSRQDILPVFEQSLQSAGLALIKQDNLYRIVPIANAPMQAGSPIYAGLKGEESAYYGVEIIPLHYVSAQNMQRVLQPLIPQGSISEIDSARNFIIAAGTADQRAAILRDVSLFDVDQMAGMSFAMFMPQSVNAETLTRDLTSIVSGPQGADMAGMVRFISLDQINAVLAISSQPRYLRELSGWAGRFDQPSNTDEKQIFVYRVQNGKAEDLANVLSKVFPNATANGIGSSEDQSGGGSIIGNSDLPEVGLNGSNAASSMVSPNNTSADSVAAGQANGQLLANDTSTSDSSNANALLGGGVTASTPGIQITADDVNNALVIRATPDEYATIKQALQQLDLQPLQVLIEASVAEVTLTSQLQYGIQYYLDSGNFKSILTTAATAGVSTVVPGFTAAFQNGNNISVILSALESLTKVDVLSAPEVVVLNNQTASLQVGDEVPIATQESQSTVTNNAAIVNSIEYQNTGVILKVTPRVNIGGLVTMDIMQEVSEVSPTTSSTLNSPTISERLISTSVAVHDGQTVALGGLISDSRTSGKSGIPFLQDIPYIGSLFSVTNNQLNRTELLVLLTPHIVGDQYQAQAITDMLKTKLIETGPVFSVGN